jgi:hypothetical protein
MEICVILISRDGFGVGSSKSSGSVNGFPLSNRDYQALIISRMNIKRFRLGGTNNGTVRFCKPILQQINHLR